MYLPEQLGRNIRHFRKAKGMTQAALAARLFLTPQNISKWENGQSVPDVENLCRVAEVLGVSTDRLLGTQAKGASGRVMIGIDGGGTKTEFCLFDERGCVLARERLAGTNPNIYGIEGAISTLKAGIDALTVRENGISAILCNVICSLKACHSLVKSSAKATVNDKLLVAIVKTNVNCEYCVGFIFHYRVFYNI
jgi:transcriptional regulator with XRE-family HTH domain